MSNCRFGVSPVNYPDPDPDLSLRWAHSHFVGFVMSRLISSKEIIPFGKFLFIIESIFVLIKLWGNVVKYVGKNPK